jgi:hypothetical protein
MLPISGRFDGSNKSLPLQQFFEGYLNLLYLIIVVQNHWHFRNPGTAGGGKTEFRHL